MFPIMDLPEELFARILKMSLVDRPPHLLHKRHVRERGYIYWRSGPPVTNARVCKSWQKLVYSTPLLWSSVQLNANHLRIGNAILRVFSKWITKAGASPLIIEFQLERASDERFLMNLYALMTFIEVIYSKQVQHLAITFPPGLPAIPLTRRISEAFRDAPFLESLSLKMPRRSSYFDERSLINLYDGSPNLNSLKCAPYLNLVRPFNSQNSLTEVDLGPFGEALDSSLNTLRNLPNVEKFKMALHFKTEIPTLMDPLELSQLKELRVSHARPLAPNPGYQAKWDDFFSKIHAPKLSKLTVKGRSPQLQAENGTVNPQNLEWTNVESFLANSSHPPIAELNLADVIIGGGHLRSALSMMTELVVLKLIRLRCTDDISHALQVPIDLGGSKTRFTCPRLDEIRIEILEESTYNSLHVADMLYTRCHGPNTSLTYTKPRSIAINNINFNVVQYLWNLFARRKDIGNLQGYQVVNRVLGYTWEEVLGNGYTLWITKDSD